MGEKFLSETKIYYLPLYHNEQLRSMGVLLLVMEDNGFAKWKIMVLRNEKCSP